MGKKRECGSETGVKRETSRFLPDYDVTDKTWYNGYNAGVRESDQQSFLRCKEINYDDHAVAITSRAAKKHSVLKTFFCRLVEF